MLGGVRSGRRHCKIVGHHEVIRIVEAVTDTALSGHSGNPALRRLSMKRTRSSARRSGGATRSRLPSLNAGSTSRKQAIAARASTIRSERALAIAATRSAVAQFGCSWRALVAQDMDAKTFEEKPGGHSSQSAGRSP